MISIKITQNICQWFTRCWNWTFYSEQKLFVAPETELITHTPYSKAD